MWCDGHALPVTISCNLRRDVNRRSCLLRRIDRGNFCDFTAGGEREREREREKERESVYSHRAIFNRELKR